MNFIAVAKDSAPAHAFADDAATPIRYLQSVTVDQVKALSVREKLQIMEAIWEDLRERFEDSDLSDSQKRLLDERRARVANGSAQLLDWDSVKGSLGRQ